MVLKFKVWRLCYEHRGKKLKRRKRRKLVVCLRDKNGVLRKVAKDAYEQAKMETWYEKYNIKERLETLLATKELKEHVRRVKQRIRKRGFVHQISLYGISKDPKTSERTYRRYEIFKANKWFQDEVAFIHAFFKAHVPLSRAGCFIFHDGKLFVDGKDKLTEFVKNVGRNKS
jgi:hypothetical protein